MPKAHQYNKKTGRIVLYIGILILASILRLYRLNTIPPGVNRDEASIGYTAYSLLMTGKDEYSRLLPLSFESFGDWKLPVYIYTTVPFVKILGLNEVAIRLPSALAGIATIAIVYFLVQLLFNKPILSLLSMLILAISPWHIHLSRVESESNIAVLLIVLGLYSFLKGIEKRNKLIVLGFFLWAITYYTYHGNHIFTSLFVLGICFLYRQYIFKIKYFLFGLLFFSLLVAFILSQTLFFADKTKIAGISIFGDPTVVHERIEKPRNEHENPSSLLSRLVHNKLTYAIQTVGQNYLNAFSPAFLFISGGTNHAHNIENFGNMYLIDAPFLILGLYFLLRKSKERHISLLLWWFFISPVAASITKDAPHTNRMFAIFPALSIIVALGIFSTIQLILQKKAYIKYLLIGFLGILYCTNILWYLDDYFIHFPRNETKYWGNGYKELSLILNSPEFNNKNIIMSHPEYSPYIYLLFYSSYSPALYQKQVVRYPPTEDAFTHVKRYDRYTFRPIQWEEDSKLKDTILVDLPENIDKHYIQMAKKVRDITLPNGEVFLSAVEY